MWRTDMYVHTGVKSHRGWDQFDSASSGQGVRGSDDFTPGRHRTRSEFAGLRSVLTACSGAGSELCTLSLLSMKCRREWYAKSGFVYANHCWSLWLKMSKTETGWTKSPHWCCLVLKSHPVWSLFKSISNWTNDAIIFSLQLWLWWAWLEEETLGRLGKDVPVRRNQRWRGDGLGWVINRAKRDTSLMIYTPRGPTHCCQLFG